jgi:GNAT superfamily N-acetyltransferase
VIELTEERYDSAVAVALVADLLVEINERYAHEIADMTPEELAAEDAEYLAEVTPEMVARPHGVFLVAWLDGEPAGCGALKPMPELAATAEVKRMYTAPGARRRGVSRVILERLESVAAELGYEQLQLETGTAQPEALALYESHGWHRIPPYGRYKDSPSSVCFAKHLTGPAGG